MDTHAIAAVQEFAEAMGIDALADDDGSVGFEFSQSGRLTFLMTEKGDELIVSLSPAMILSDGRGYGTLIALGGYRGENDAFYQPGITRDGRPVLATRLPAQGLALAHLETAFAGLKSNFAQAGF